LRVNSLRCVLLALSAGALLSPFAASQVAPEVAKTASQKHGRERIDMVDHIARMKRIALTGTLGFPELPPVYWDSPRDDLQFVDRFPFSDQASSAADSTTPAALDGYIAAGSSGTGTTIPEIFKYLLPPGYESYVEGAPPIPLVMAYHGYGASANSVALLSEVDDECYARGWAYFAPTGMDDQLFGSPLCLQNVTAALNWMLDHFNIDRERIYLVGFSMGGGIVTNYAARHRDPEGTMFAALGIVSGTFDWTMSWKLGDSTLKTLMQSPYNFSGPASSSTYKFGYQQASGLFYTYNSYPPVSPTNLPNSSSSLATNLGTIPTYIVWDTGDTLIDVVQQEPHIYSMLQGLGGTVEYHTTSGTLHPTTGLPAPHSWAVLNEHELFDFFEGKTANRKPASFHALIAESGSVSWLSMEQLFNNAFSTIDADSDAQIPYAHLINVLNAQSVSLDMETMGFPAGQPARIQAGTTSGKFKLTLGGFADPPAYLVDSQTGDLVTGTESDPVAGTLLQDVSTTSSIDAQVVTDPTWTTALHTEPDPVSVGGALTLDIDAPATSSSVLLFIGFSEKLATIAGGYHITLALGPPTIFLQLPLDANGDANLSAMMPNDVQLSGLTLRLQTVGISGSGGGVNSISNLWALHVQ